MSAADGDDVVRRFTDLAASSRRCFWLDGGGAREWSGRRSMLGVLDPADVSVTFDAARGQVLRHQGGASQVVGDDIFAVLETEIARSAPDDHWVGYLGYSARRDLPASITPAGPDRLPDAVWMRCREVEFVDHGAPASSQPGATPVPAGGEEPVSGEYATAFAAVQEALHAGDSYEVNLTHRVAMASGLDPVSAYLRLRGLNPAPYAGFLQHDLPGHRAWLLSSSPERYAVIDAQRTLETKPIKGTTPRGVTTEDDVRLREHLASDPKFRAENLMIVDLLRNDLSLVCVPGTVEVPVLMDVESYATVHQLVSTVRGRLRDDVGTVSALRALFPAGSMTGAPKLRTMQIIDQVESTPREVYSGAFGWISGDGRADLGVVIRSLMTAGDGHWTLGTGGGITVRSDVAEEHAEAGWKAARLLRVFE